MYSTAGWWNPNFHHFSFKTLTVFPERLYLLPMRKGRWTGPVLWALWSVACAYPYLRTPPSPHPGEGEFGVEGGATPVQEIVYSYPSCYGVPDDQRTWRETYQWATGRVWIRKWMHDPPRLGLLLGLGHLALWRDIGSPYDLTFWEHGWVVEGEVLALIPRKKTLSFYGGASVGVLLHRTRPQEETPTPGLDMFVTSAIPGFFLVPQLEVTPDFSVVASFFSPGLAFVWHRGPLQVSGYVSANVYETTSWTIIRVTLWPLFLFIPTTQEFDRMIGPWMGLSLSYHWGTGTSGP